MTAFTVLGSTGFVGRHLTAHLRELGHAVNTPARNFSGLGAAPAGHIIYCIGLTGNYRSRPHDTVEAHVSVLSRLLQTAQFDSLLYLSSTRVYRGLDAEATAGEETPLPLNPGPDGIYDYSKLLGESLCLGADRPGLRVARLSNVYGAGMHESTFLGALKTAFAAEGRAIIQDNPASAKDYISIDDVVPRLAHIALQGRERIYNVASGQRVSCADIAKALQADGRSVSFAATPPPPRIFPQIGVARIESACGPCRHDLLSDIPQLFQ